MSRTIDLAARIDRTTSPLRGYVVLPFNRAVTREGILESSVPLEQLAPALEVLATRTRFWLLKIEGSSYAWAARTEEDPGRTIVFSKRLLPVAAISGLPFKLEILQRMSHEKIRAWASKVHFFQGFAWLPDGTKAANSALVWEAISGAVSFSGKSVVDIGTNFGYHAFEASKAGAVVYGQDRNPNVIRVAEFINDRIEMQDVEFGTGIDETEVFDIVLYLSVHHQGDQTYSGLEKRVDKLRSMAREAVVLELIVPALRGRLSEAAIDDIVRGKPLLRYRHNVRGIRKIYLIKK